MSWATISSSHWRSMRVSSMGPLYPPAMPALPWFDIFIVSYVVWGVLACVSPLLTRRSPPAALPWIFAFVALPVVSGLYYMVFGPRRLQRRKRRYGVARSLPAPVSEPLRNTCAATRPTLAPDAAALAAVGRRLGQGAPTFASAV